MELEGLEKVIRSRRSVRSWQDKEVPEELLLKAVELATWAPNAGNQQGWRFFIILKKDTINAIADALQSSVDQMASWPESNAFREELDGSRKRACFFRSAPAAIVIAAGKYESLADKILILREKSDSKAAQTRQWRNTASSRLQTAASAAAYLSLILHQMGLGAVWMTGPMQIKGDIEKILGVPQGWDVVTFIPVGYPADTPRPRERKPVSEVCWVIK